MRKHAVSSLSSFVAILSLMIYCGSILFPSCLSGDEDVEYVVELGSEAVLHPTALMPVSSSSTSLSIDYLKMMLDVLAFDINANGMMAIVDDATNKKVEKLVKDAHQGELPIKELRSIPVSYILTPKVTDSNLVLSVTSLADGLINSFSPVPLCGNSAIDRGRIHQLSDYLFSSLFGKEGIATTRILYSKKTSSPAKGGRLREKIDTKAEIYLADYDGGNIRQMTTLKSVSVSPQWIPSKGLDSKKPQAFMFVSYLIGQPKLYIMNFKDGKTTRLSKMRGNQLTPAVSKDGNFVLFCSDILGCSDLYMVPFEIPVGEIQKPRQIYKTPSYATGCPTFSPDGKRVAFVSNKSGSPKIYILDLPSSDAKLKDLKPKLISKRCRENSSPVWSPDGKKIAYNARTSSDRQIWIYDIEHEIEYQLTQGSGHKENPSWAPDSSHIVYQGMKDGTWQLFLVDMNRKSTIQITHGEGDKQFPAWEPR